MAGTFLILVGYNIKIPGCIAPGLLAFKRTTLIMNYRKYDPKKDKEAVNQIWLEVGWIEKGNPKPMDTLIEGGRTIIADVNDRPECLVVSWLGDIDYLGEKLPFSCIAGVTTSLIARQQKLAARLTATKIALDAMDGAAVSGLGIFEQGYYDKLGYGTSNYENLIRFSPKNLKVNAKPCVPIRLSIEDLDRIHASRLKRKRSHGSVNASIIAPTRAELEWSKSGFGLGYCDDRGELTHSIWMTGLGKESGPYQVQWMIYRNYDQLMELFALMKSFGDQIRLITMLEPPEIQFQDLLAEPVYYRTFSEKSKFENITKAVAWRQMRICDIEKCLSVTHLPGEDLRFNLDLTDPIEKYLDDKIEWRGVAGSYVVTFGENSSAQKGRDENLPTMKASVNAFTRLWYGVLPASVLAFSDDLSAPEDLLNGLDRKIRLPRANPDWDF